MPERFPPPSPQPSSTQPALAFGVARRFDLVANDRGSGATQDLSLWRPRPRSGYFLVGDYAQADYGPPKGSALIVRASFDDLNAPLLAPPRAWEQVFTDAGSGGDQSWSLWRAEAPDGYVALGAVAAEGYEAPVIGRYRCVRADLVAPSIASAPVWSIRGSTAHAKVTLWSVTGLSGLFVTQANFARFKGAAYRLTGAP